MRRITLTTCFLVVATGLTPAVSATDVPGRLQGTWLAEKAEIDGNKANNVIGHKLSFASNRFEIRSKDGKPLYEGNMRTDPNAKPPAIDFEHTSGALAKKVWMGIYRLDGDTLTICDNAPNLNKPRPTTFEWKAGTGDECVTFGRAKP
jgi:uncharacterized protein (TIGR03067 family)